jgi:hypothetical protein
MDETTIRFNDGFSRFQSKRKPLASLLGTNE